MRQRTEDIEVRLHDYFGQALIKCQQNDNNFDYRMRTMLVIIMMMELEIIRVTMAIKIGIAKRGDEMHLTTIIGLMVICIIDVIMNIMMIIIITRISMIRMTMMKKAFKMINY